jgi:hypothetical protein
MNRNKISSYKGKDVFYFINAWLLPGAQPQIFIMGTDPEAIYNLCLILKIMLWKLYCKCNCNITLFTNTFILPRYDYNYVSHDSLT